MLRLIEVKSCKYIQTFHWAFLSDVGKKCLKYLRRDLKHYFEFSELDNWILVTCLLDTESHHTSQCSVLLKEMEKSEKETV